MVSDESMARRIGSRIRALRRRVGLSADVVAERVGLSRSQYLRLESGVVGMTVQRLVAVADVLGVTLRDLIPPENPDADEPDAFEWALRGTGLSAQDRKQVMDYIRILRQLRREQAREHGSEDADAQD
ncbi:helix-turn-helix domain protein [Sulfobacillus acidophilus DSM 10332]|uniref:Helix-turn-helix domain protein n=1 Tax=Sulfobacillus acidophilus (strain ATCC 700253 / DSM 10332 / NAL) TaxID=679936 RepID=G8TZ89_SULAD|nr:helix-turn-helix domain protein [Sulfobacillus acidophilus DSM 10332]